MKSGIKKIVGKTIESVVVTRSECGTMMHVFLSFSDNTYFEVWANADVPGRLMGCSDLDRGGIAEIKHYARGQEIVLEAPGGSQ